jgi:hypothetical protein
MLLNHNQLEGLVMKGAKWKEQETRKILRRDFKFSSFLIERPRKNSRTYLFVFISFYIELVHLISDITL